MRAFLLVVSALLITGVGCQLAGPGNDQGELQLLEQQILDMIGEAPASAVSSCKAIAFGSKPCGGPWRYLVYSTEATDELELARLVETYNTLQDRVNRERGGISDCLFVEPPAVALEGGYCRTANDAGSKY